MLELRDLIIERIESSHQFNYCSNLTDNASNTALESEFQANRKKLK